MANVTIGAGEREALLIEVLDGIDGPLRDGRGRLVDELLDRGYDVETLREAHRADRLVVLLLDEAIHETAFLTARDVANACGLPVDDVVRMSHLLGIDVADADTPGFDEFACEAVGTLKLARAYGLSQLAIDDMLLVLGRHMSRLAADMEVIVGNELGRPGDTEYELAHRYADGARVLAPSAVPLVRCAFTAHLRDRMRDIFVTAEEAEYGSLRAVTDVAVAFVDVVGFTSLGERVDAGQLRSIADRLVDVAEAALVPPVRVVKSLGDAILLMSRDASALVAVLTRIADVMASDLDTPPIHCGVAYGPTNCGGADIYGAPVNLASRITDIAPSGEIWADFRMVQACPEAAWIALGPREVKGAEAPIEVFRLEAGQ
jgi:adenylate cyclase